MPIMDHLLATHIHHLCMRPLLLPMCTHIVIITALDTMVTTMDHGIMVTMDTGIKCYRSVQKTLNE